MESTEFKMFLHCQNHQFQQLNKAGYTAKDAPGTRLREGITDRQSERPTDGRTDLL